jgi:hypothetical protein
MVYKTLNLFNFPCIPAFSNPLIHLGGYITHLYNNIMASYTSIAVYISNISLNISLQMYIHRNYDTFYLLLDHSNIKRTETYIFVYDFLVSCLRSINTKEGMCIMNKRVWRLVDPKRTCIHPLSRRRAALRKTVVFF